MIDEQRIDVYTIKHWYFCLLFVVEYIIFQPSNGHCSEF